MWRRKKLLFIGKTIVSVGNLIYIGTRSSGRMKLSDTKKKKIKGSWKGLRPAKACYV